MTVTTLTSREFNQDLSRAKRAERIDHVAAGFILQGALDRLKHLEG